MALLNTYIHHTGLVMMDSVACARSERLIESVWNRSSCREVGGLKFPLGGADCVGVLE